MKLSIKEKLGYSLGDTASHFVWDLVGFWLLIFYTDIYGLTPALAGVIMFVGSIWDAIMDPVVGIISDRTESRWGKFRPYMLFGSIPYAILAVMAFTTPEFSSNGKFIYALITCLLLRTAYAFVNLPYSSLGAVMTNDSNERAGLNTYRFIAAYVGQFVVTGLALYLVKWFGADNPAQGYQSTVALFGALSIIFFLITFFTTRERVPQPKKQDNNVMKDFKYLFMNKAWIVLTCVGIVSFIMFAMQNAAIAYYFKYYIHNAENVQLFNVLGTIALIVALPAGKPLAKRFGNKMVYIMSSVVSGIFFALIYAAGDNLYLIYTFNILAKMAYAPAVPLLWTMLADVADYGEWKFNRRTTGLTFSASVLAQKLGWAIGAAAAGWILEATMFVPNAEVQCDSAMFGIRALCSIIPGVLYASCALILIFYNLDQQTIDTMKTELEERRQQN